MWNELSMNDRAKYIRLAVENGITDLKYIRDIYNSTKEEEYNLFDGGGPIYSKITRRWYNRKGEPIPLGDRYYHKNSKEYVQYNSDGTITRFTPSEAAGRLSNNIGRNINGTSIMSIDDTRKTVPYLGSNKKGKAGDNETRQKFYDQAGEYTDSVKSISKRYGINPDLVASRIAKEGPIDKFIQYQNDFVTGYNSYLDSPAFSETIGPAYGLDYTGGKLKSGELKVTTTAPYTYEISKFTNEKDKITDSLYSPQWWFGIEATAAELKQRRDKLKKKHPKASNEWLDAAASASFNLGETGVEKNLNLVPNYKPFIKLK